MIDAATLSKSTLKINLKLYINKFKQNNILKTNFKIHKINIGAVAASYINMNM